MRHLTLVFRALWRLAFILAIAVPLVPGTLRADELDYSIQNGRFYTQANGQGGAGGTGYSITDEGDIPFWREFRRLGGVDALGYPASRRFMWDGFVVQATQKVVLQWQPDKGMFFVNVFDVMSNQGRDAWLQNVRQTPPAFDTSADAGLGFEQIKARHLAFLDQNPAIKARYLADADPIMNFGLPMSYQDYGNVFVVRAQRAVFQQWLVDVPWARAGQVTIANGGDIAKEAGLFAAEATTPEAPGTTTVVPIAAQPPAAPAPPPAAVAPISPIATGARYPGVGYGMQVDPGSDLSRALALTQNAGFNWVKVQLRWDSLEGSKGAINWGFIDNAVNQVSARGLRLLFSVVTAPSWSRPADTDRGVPGPPANPQDFADFVGAIAARHKGRVHAYEIWNEQNLWYEWGGRGRKLSASNYVNMLRVAYNTIKRVDPDAVVLSGAPTPTGVNDGDIAIDDVAFIEQMYQAGVKDVSDAIAAHPSGYNNPPDDDSGTRTVSSASFKGHPSFYYRRFEQIRDAMVRHGDGNKQIWFTEFGWASSPNPYQEYAYARDNGEGQQAQYLVRAFQIAKERGYVGPMFVWNLNYAASAEPNDRYAKKAFAILNPDFSPRAAYGALAAMPK